MPDRKLALFVCLHGSAKSLIAAEHFNRIAAARGLPILAVSAGVEPDASVPPPVVTGLGADGVDVAGYRPRAFTPTALQSAVTVVTFGCDVGVVPPDVQHSRWDDLPMVSDGFGPARDAIVTRVEALVDRLDSARQ